MPLFKVGIYWFCDVNALNNQNWMIFCIDGSHYLYEKYYRILGTRDTPNRLGISIIHNNAHLCELSAQFFFAALSVSVVRHAALQRLHMARMCIHAKQKRQQQHCVLFEFDQTKLHKTKHDEMISIVDVTDRVSHISDTRLHVQRVWSKERKRKGQLNKHACNTDQS